MLILSRREAEKVLFPKLGITIEVTRVQGRTVRLGIEAPDEIRIIRAELEDTADLEIRKRQNNSNRPSESSWNVPKEMQQCLDAANLAIHLAQNQLRQQLNDKAEEALDHALECLENLESVADRNAGSAPASSTIREAKIGYHFQAKKVAIVVDQDNQLGPELQNKLDSIGYETLQLDSGEALIEFLQSRDQPNLVITLHRPLIEPLQPAEEPLMAEDEFHHAFVDAQESWLPQSSQSAFRMFGVGGLQKSSQTFPLGEVHVTSWFSESTDAEALASCFT